MTKSTSNKKSTSKRLPSEKVAKEAQSATKKAELVFVNLSKPTDSKDRHNVALVRRTCQRPFRFGHHGVTGPAPIQIVSYNNSSTLPAQKQIKPQDVDLTKYDKELPFVVDLVKGGTQAQRKWFSEMSLKDNKSVQRSKGLASLPCSSHNPFSSYMDNIGPMKADPFDCLPIKAEDRSNRLMYDYLESWHRPLSESAQVQSRLVKYRQGTWYPLAIQSVATQRALLAYAEISPWATITQESEKSLENHKDSALSTAHTEIQRSILESSSSNESLCLGITFLLLIALHMDDRYAFRMHGRGLAALIRKRRGHANFAFNPECSSPDLSQEPSIGPSVLLEVGLIGRHLAPLFDWTWCLMTLARITDGDHLTASAVSQHYWLNVDETTSNLCIKEAGVSRKVPWTPFERACVLVVRACWIRAFPGANFLTPLNTFPSKVRALLEATDLQLVLSTCPESLLWIALSLGSTDTDPETKRYYTKLMYSAQSFLPFMTYKQASIMLLRHWMWSPVWNVEGSEFWEE